MARPDDWVGQIVSIHILDASGGVHGELIEVNDRGVAIRLDQVEGGASGDLEDTTSQLLFHPWATVKWIQISEEIIASTDAG